MSTTSYTSDTRIHCPACKDGVVSDLDDYQWGMSEIVEEECPACLVTLVIMRTVSVSYTAEEKRG